MTDDINPKLSGISRKSVLKGFAGTSAAALSAGLLGPGASKVMAQDSRSAGVILPVDGKYVTAPLRKDVIRVTAVQSPIRAADPDDPKKVMTSNLNAMLESLDQANGFPGHQDLVCFHEQPIMGWNPWTREEALKVTIEIPGKETEALGKKAKEYGCYIAFGTYAKSDDWPGHLLLIGVLIGPDGEVAAQHWKLHNVRLSPTWTMFTTSVWDVLDQYIEMYGADAVLPIAHTDIGNLSLTVSPYDPDLHRALAIKGAEICVRFSSGGFSVEDSKSAALFNQNYVITTNQSLSPDQPGFPAYSGPGGTSIYGPFGREIDMAESFHEEHITAAIPIAQFRKTHRLPDIPLAMVMPVYEQYTTPNPPNLQTDYQPDTPEEAAQYFFSNRTW
ncbi:MAG: nitrilase-related carbon-nitrogen hydrolase [Rhodospirillaceae bacterium]|nr:nitrilase-related carbon-nitrogen hydrolase [Rhodospirillaceae bacterium]